MTSLEMKLRRLADGLTPEEAMLLRADIDPDELTPSLRAKLERSADTLTPEEWAELEALEASIDAEDEAEVQGHMVNVRKTKPHALDVSHLRNQTGLGNISSAKPVNLVAPWLSAIRIH